MHSGETRPGVSRIDFTVYLIAIIAWGLAIVFSPYEANHDWIIDVSLPRYLAAASVAAAFIVIAISFLLRRTGTIGSPVFSLYAAAAFYALYLANHHLPLSDYFPKYGGGGQAAYLTPVFCAVMGVYLSLRYEWGLLRLFLFTLTISFAHYYAMDFAGMVFDDNTEPFKAVTEQLPFTLDNTMIVPGFIGGIVGAGLSFLGLSIAGRGFRELDIIILYTLVLGVIGALGLALSDDGSFNNYGQMPFIWLYPPWQIVFGFMLANLAGKVGPVSD